MYFNFIYAFRIQDSVFVLIDSNLPRSCDTASVSGTYPGNIFYFIDPGSARVFIDFSSPSEPCNEMLTPWVTSVLLRDSTHDTVEIFVNGDNIMTVPIIDYPIPYSFV